MRSSGSTRSSTLCASAPRRPAGDASTRAEEARERLTKRREELREQLSGEELRKAYQNLVERGEAAMERLRTRTKKAVPAKKAPAKKSTKK